MGIYINTGLYVLETRFPAAMERIAIWIPSERPQPTETTYEDSSFVTHKGLHLSLEVVLSFWVCVQVCDALVARFPAFVTLNYDTYDAVVPRFPAFVTLNSAQQRRQLPCPAV
jgi:hypothetical protein